MLTEDYLMRYIRLATVAIARALGLKTTGLYQDALFVINQALEQVLGLNFDLLNNLDDQNLIEMMMTQAGFDTDRLTVVADLVKEQGDIYAALGEPPQRTASYLRALNFYLEAVLNGGPQQQASPGEKIASLVELLQGIELPPDLAFSLFSYYDISSQFNMANRLMDSLLRRFGLQSDLEHIAGDYYNRLLAKSDSELTDGGVSRLEIQTRLDQLGTTSR